MSVHPEDLRRPVEHHAPLATPVRLLMRLPVPWVFVLAYLTGLALQELLPAPNGSGAAALAAEAAAGVLFAIGAAIAGWGLVLFHRRKTTTAPGTASAALVTSGPYRFTRNPMYIGLILLYLGEAAALFQVWPLLPLLAVIAYLNWTVIPLEEASLTSFGDAYASYQARIHRWL